MLADGELSGAGGENSNHRLRDWDAGCESPAMTPSPSPTALVQISPGFPTTSNVTAAPGGAGSRSEQSAVCPPSGEPASGIVIAALPDGDPSPHACASRVGGASPGHRRWLRGYV